MPSSAVVDSCEGVPGKMVNLLDATARAMTHARMSPPVWAASPLAADSGRVVWATANRAGLCVQGTGMPRIIPPCAPEPVSGQAPTQEYVHKARVTGFGRGAMGPHPAREPV